MIDGIPTEVTNQPLGSLGSVAESPSQTPFIISPIQTAGEPQVTAEVAPAPERSLKDIYTGYAVRYRELGKKQLDSSLTDEEIKEREDLNQMAGFGLFEANLSEDQLKAKDAAYKALIEAEAIELKDPQASAERYRLLGTKLINSGLIPDELAEYNRLKAYADLGKFEQQKAA